MTTGNPPSKTEGQTDMTDYQPPCAQPSASKQWIAGRIETLLSHYFQPDQPIEVTEAAMVDWIKALKDFPQAEIDQACASYLKDQPRRRPTPGGIYSRVCASMQFKTRHTARPAIAPPDPEPERTTEQKAEAESIIRKAGFSQAMRDKLHRNRMATSREELEKPAQRKPHWTETVDPNGPEMRQLREARIKSGLISPHE